MVNVIAGAPVNFVAPGVYGSTIAGGGSVDYFGVAITNSIAANFSVIGGGYENTVLSNASYSVICGGSGNILYPDASYSVIIGGGWNRILTNAYGSVIGGGSGNAIYDDALYSLIGGGAFNSIGANAHNSFIGGGFRNTIQTNVKYCAIGGGYENVIQPSADYSTIGGGNQNMIHSNAFYSCIAGGNLNQVRANASFSFIGGGDQNTIQTNAYESFIGGGFRNTIQIGARFAAIPGGIFNTAAADHTFAAGRRAKANQRGAFVWADSFDLDFSSTATNEFAARATGGVRFVSGVDGNGLPVAGVSLPAGSGSWSSLSDRNAKTNFVRINTRELLDRLAQLPIQSWNYKSQSESARHIGPTAQDFHAAFTVGEDDQHIATVDADGVALAAIQGLNQKLEEQLKEKEVELEALKERLAAIEKLLASRKVETGVVR